MPTEKIERNLSARDEGRNQRCRPNGETDARASFAAPAARAAVEFSGHCAIHLKAVGDAEVRRKLEELGLGFAVRGSSANDLHAMTRDQLAKYGRVMRKMGIANE